MNKPNIHINDYNRYQMKGLKMLIVNDAPKLKDYLKLRKTVTLNITVLSRI